MEKWRRLGTSWLARKQKNNRTSLGSNKIRSQERPLSFLGSHDGDTEETEVLPG